MKKVFALVLSIIMLASAAVAVSADGSPFTDVKTSRWSYDSIKYAVEKGYMNGVGDNKFDPAGSMTRGMVVTVLYRREGSPAVTFRDDFTDVKAGKYYSDAVIWAKDEGVVNGITETTFDPNGKITREQLATMLSRFSERCPVSVPDAVHISFFHGVLYRLITPARRFHIGKRRSIRGEDRCRRPGEHYNRKNQRKNLFHIRFLPEIDFT